MLNFYTLHFIPGTLRFVQDELLAKFHKVEILETKKDLLTFQIENKLEDFSNLLTPLRIEQSGGKTLKLDRRDWRVGFVSAGINPSLAAVMCMVAKINENDLVLDPFCGGSVIPITASKYFYAQKVFAVDLSGKAVDISQANFNAAEIPKDKYMLARSNVSMLRFPKEYFTKVVTNMPFGIRVADHDTNAKTYYSFAKKMHSLLKENGTVTALTQEKRLLESVMKAAGFTLEENIAVEQGGLKPNIYLYRKN